MATRAKPWDRFKVGRPSKKAMGFSADCVPFDTVFHHTHLETAYIALREGTIRSGLVHDKSRLNTKRVRVIWLSPNDWENAGGSRYGNVGFAFRINPLLRGKRVYWVESKPYQIQACRFLITATDYNGELERYDPSRDKGPWWKDKSTGTHYWNGEFCLELMYESDLNLAECSRVILGSHSNQWCCLNRYNPGLCPDIGLRRNKGGALLVARVVGTGLGAEVLGFTRVDDAGKIVPTDELEESFDALIRRVVRNVAFTGNLRSGSPLAASLAQAILMTYSLKQDEQRKALASMFLSEEELSKSCMEAVATAFQLSRPKDLINPP
jgi:hypothetical protein